MLPNQRAAFAFMNEGGKLWLAEMPTGSGKTLVGMTLLLALAEREPGPFFYTTPTKALVEQAVKAFPHEHVGIVYGRNEYPCLYYAPDESGFRPTADDVPCSMLKGSERRGSCPHRVNQDNGTTAEEGALSCPYLMAKYLAKRQRVVVCTLPFYMFTQVFSREWGTPSGLIIDEVHELADSIRRCLESEISDVHLRRCISVLKDIGANAPADALQCFLSTMIAAIERRSKRRASILEIEDIEQLVGILLTIDERELQQSINAAIVSGVLDPTNDRVTLKKLERLVRGVGRTMRQLQYAVPSGQYTQVLNYVIATWTQGSDEMPKNGNGSSVKSANRAKYTLTIKPHYVVPIIRQLLGTNTLAMSATIGDSRVLISETGLSRSRFRSFPSNFPAKNTRIFMPTDTKDLAKNNRRRDDVKEMVKWIVSASLRLACDHKIRSLVLLISEKERELFLRHAGIQGLAAVTYGEARTAKGAVQTFKDGEGDILLGTEAMFGKGIDLPNQIAPVTFILRPGYPNPKDPETQFLLRQLGEGRFWGLTNWSVMINALQARGRNVRSVNDKGVTFFVSQQFRRFLLASLPEYLHPSYVGTKTFEECIAETLALLK